MFYTVIVLICFATDAPADCNHLNAMAVMEAPDPQLGAAQCMKYGIEYAAQSNLVKPGKTYPKVYCKPFK